MKAIPFILRDHREQLWRHWADALPGRVESDYQELIASPLGERILRTFVDDLISWTEAEEYERPGILREVEARTTSDGRHRLTLGFTATDMIEGLHTLRGTIIEVLVDALVLDEMPAYADALDQIKTTNAFLDRLVRATIDVA